MAEANFKDTCGFCRFFVENDRMGVCHRYPEAVNKHMNNWCGEYIPSKSTKTIDNIVEALAPVQIKFVEETKKPGRPRKVKNES